MIFFQATLVLKSPICDATKRFAQYIKPIAELSVYNEYGILSNYIQKIQIDTVDRHYYLKKFIFKSLLAGIPCVGISASILIPYENQSQDDLRPFAAFTGFHNPRTTATSWIICLNTINQNKRNIDSIISFMDDYLTNSHDTKSIDIIRQRIPLYKERAIKEKYNADLIFYDLPLVIAYKCTIFQILDAKGWTDDDEKKMDAVAILLSEFAMNNQSKAVSPYTGKIFIDLIKTLKDELGDDEFKELQSKAALFKTANEE